MNDLNSLLPAFLDSLGGRQSRANRRNHNTRLSPFLVLHGHKSPDQVTRSDVLDWLAAIDSRGYRPATVAGYRQALKAFFGWLVRERLLEASPAENVRVGSFTSRRSKMPAESEVLRVSSLAHEWSTSEQPHKVRDAAIWLLSVGSGARLGEIRNLRRSDTMTALQRGPDEWGVYQVVSAGKTGQVLLRFGGDVADAVSHWLEVRPACRVDVLFVTTEARRSRSDPESRFRPLTRSAATRGYQRICEAAGLRKPILSHALRHRLGDRTTRRHGPKVAALLLNHKDADTAATAIAFYTHPVEADMSRAIADAYVQTDGRGGGGGDDVDAALRQLFKLD